MKWLSLTFIIFMGCKPAPEVEPNFLRSQEPIIVNIFPEVILPSPGFYETGEELFVTLRFSEEVSLEGPLPYTTFEIAGIDRVANCSQSSSNELKCSYELGSSGIDFSLDSPPKLLSFSQNGALIQADSEGLIEVEIDPISLTGVRTTFSDHILWLDASDDDTLYGDSACSSPATGGSAVRCWEDKVSNIPFSNGNSDAPSLVEAAVNDLQSLHFTNDRLDAPSPVALEDFTAFVVYNVSQWATLNYWIGSFGANPGLGLGFGGTWTSGAPGRGIFSIAKQTASGPSTRISSTVEPSDWGVATYTREKTFRNTLENTPYLEEVPHTQTGLSFSAIGKREDNHSCCFHHGGIAEVLIFNSVLNEDERFKVWCRLSKKYDLNFTGC